MKNEDRPGKVWQAVVAARKLVILVVGVSLVLLGLALLVLPGPGILVVIAGLAVLAIEFTWAATLLERTREQARKAHGKARRRALRHKENRTLRPKKRRGTSI